MPTDWGAKPASDIRASSADGGSRQVLVRMPAAEEKRLRRYAESKGISAPAIARQAIDEFLTRQEALASVPTQEARP